MVFGCVVDVYILRSRVLLEAKVLKTIDFNEHLHTFAVAAMYSFGLLICMTIEYMAYTSSQYLGQI